MIKNGKIILLENIVVDNNLPKYKKENNGVTSGFFDNILIGNNSVGVPMDSQGDFMRYPNNSISNRFKLWLHKKLFIKQSKRPKSISYEELLKFFESVKESVSKLDKKNIDDVLNSYSTVLENAKFNNQIALVERINDYISTLKYELLLSTSKFNKFLSEDDIVKFHNVASVHEKYKTGLCLTYVKNFIKIIPEEITKLRKEADELKVFDNYVILHYDFSGKSVADTKKEIEKKKDPILFGVVKNSNKLYYIGDWIDDYCDLTLDVIIKKLGTKPSVIDTKLIKSEIQKI